MAIFHVHLFNKPIACNDHVKRRSIYHLLFKSQVFDAFFCAFVCERIRERKKQNAQISTLFMFSVDGTDKKTLSLDKYFLLLRGPFDNLDLLKIETLQFSKMTEHIQEILKAINIEGHNILPGVRSF